MWLGKEVIIKNFPRKKYKESTSWSVELPAMQKSYNFGQTKILNIHQRTGANPPHNANS